MVVPLRSTLMRFSADNLFWMVSAVGLIVCVVVDGQNVQTTGFHSFSCRLDRVCCGGRTKRADHRFS